MKKERCIKGFTLIELLVVVLIIGILAAIALPQYQFVVARAKYKQAVLATRAIMEAERLYYLEHGTIATDLTQLDLTFGGTYKNSYATKDKIQFNWGVCTLSSFLDMPSCQVNSPFMLYSLDPLPNVTKQICVADVTSRLAIKVCEAELPNAPFHDYTNYCASRTCRVFRAPWP